MSCVRCPGLNTLYSISCIRLLPAWKPPNSPTQSHYPFAGTQECSSWNVYLCAFVPCVQLFPDERSACVQYYKIIFKPHSESRKSPSPEGFAVHSFEFRECKLNFMLNSKAPIPRSPCWFDSLKVCLCGV